MLNNLPNINLLRSFECAARHQSYGLAANELCISQAAVSQQMRQLEATLASKLFLRKHKQMVLTECGEKLFNATQQAFSILQNTLGEINNKNLAGNITITSTQAFTSLWLMPKLNKFSALHPEIKINVMSSPSFDDLKQNNIDLAIRFGNQVVENIRDKLSCDFFGEDEVIAVCSAQLAKTIKFKSPEDFLKTWLVSLEKPGNYDWPSWFKQANVVAYKTHQNWTKVNSTDMALNAVISGHGVTLAAQYLCSEQLKSGQLVTPINIAHPNKVKCYFVYDPHSIKMAPLNQFMKWLKNEMCLEYKK